MNRIQRLPLLSVCCLALLSGLSLQCASPGNRQLDLKSALAPAAAPVESARPQATADSTYFGLTLDAWMSTVPRAPVPASYPPSEAKARMEALLSALEAFAPSSDQAISHLAGLAHDRDEDTRSRASEILVWTALGRTGTAQGAMDALVALLGDPDLVCGIEPAYCLQSEIASLDPEVPFPQQALPLVQPTQEELLRTLREAPEEVYLENILDFILDLEEQAPGGIARAAAILQEMPREADREVDGEDLTSFAWHWIDPEDDAPDWGLDLALAAAQAGTRFTPEEPYAWNTLAFTLWRLGDRPACLEAMRRCIATATAQGAADIKGFERNLQMLEDDANWTEQARATARNRPE